MVSLDFFLVCNVLFSMRRMGEDITTNTASFSNQSNNMN